MENVYRQIQVNSMYWDGMKKKFPTFPFRPEDVEYEKNQENEDSIYMVITHVNPVKRGNMIYWRWGSEAKFYHHLNALYQVIEDREMPRPFIDQLGILWEKCKNPGTRFHGIGLKRFPNNERNDEKRLEKRFEDTKRFIVAIQPPNDLTNRLETVSFQDLVDNTELRSNILNMLNLLIQPQIQSRSVMNRLTRRQELQQQQVANENQKSYLDLFMILYDIKMFISGQLTPMDYMVAFILKTYEKVEIERNEKNSFKIFGLKTNETIWFDPTVFLYKHVDELFKHFLGKNTYYLAGTSGQMEDQRQFFTWIQDMNSYDEKRLMREYFINYFQPQIYELNQQIPTFQNRRIRNYYQGKDLLDIIVKLPKRERKIVASIFREREPMIYYFQDKKLYLSRINLPIFIFLLNHKKDNEAITNVLGQYTRQITTNIGARGLA